MSSFVLLIIKRIMFFFLLKFYPDWLRLEFVRILCTRFPWVNPRTYEMKPDIPLPITHGREHNE